MQVHFLQSVSCRVKLTRLVDNRSEVLEAHLLNQSLRVRGWCPECRGVRHLKSSQKAGSRPPRSMIQVEPTIALGSALAARRCSSIGERHAGQTPSGAPSGPRNKTREVGPCPPQRSHARPQLQPGELSFQLLETGLQAHNEISPALHSRASRRSKRSCSTGLPTVRSRTSRIA